MKAVKIITAILIAAVLIFIGIFVYICYFYYTEGRNSKQNSQALHIGVLINSALSDPEYSGCSDDMIISNDKKAEYHNDLCDDPDELLDKLSSQYDIGYDKGAYYIEVRNREVYRVIYAKWKYSGFVGTNPDPNNECRIYKKEADKAAEEFREYLKSKA